MDETSPVFENFRNKMQAFGQPIRGTTRRVSASKFLGRDNIGEQVEINSRKITILKNVIQAQNITTGLMVKSLSTTNEGLEKSILDIRLTMFSILNTLKAQEKFEMMQFLDTQRREENQRRRSREGLLESDDEKPNIIQRGVNKILQPVKNIFDRIIGFFLKLFAGKILLSFLNFFSNPRNSAILNFVAGFVDSMLPVIVTGAAIFAIAVKGLIPILTGVTGLLIRAATISGGLGLTNTLSGIFRGTGLKNMIKGAAGPKITGQSKNIFRQGSSIFKTLFLRRSRGGIVPGSGNTDTVPAMLTPGEVVISKPAVKKFGLANLLRLNASVGASNIPKIKDGISYANEGMVAGLLNNLMKLSSKENVNIMTEKAEGFKPILQNVAENLGQTITKDDLQGIKNLKEDVPNFLLSGGPKPTPPVNLFKKLEDTAQTLLPVMTQTFNVEESPIGDLKEILNQSFGNPDLTPESFDNDLNQVSLLQPSVDKLNTLGLFA